MARSLHCAFFGCVALRYLVQQAQKIGVIIRLHELSHRQVECNGQHLVLGWRDAGLLLN